MVVKVLSFKEEYWRRVF